MIYTYTGIKDEIKQRLSLLSDWNTTLYYGVYDRIIDLLAYTANQLVYLAEFYFKESKWVTATKKSSLTKLAKWLRYIPYRKSGAIGELSLSADPSFGAMYSYTGKIVNIPRWCRFTNTASSLNTYCTESVNYETGQIGSITINIKEGEPKQLLYISTGAINEKVYIYSDSTDNEEIEVLIVDGDNNTLYTATYTTNLYLVNDTTTYYYEVVNAPDDSYIYIMFGDGITSRQLNVGERILVKYADTLGSEGDITSSSVITVIKDTLYDEDNSIATLYITNADAITGGSDVEDIESIRNNANNLFQVGNLLSSVENWQTIINSAPYVYKSIVWSVESLGGSLVASDQNTVYVSAVSNTGEALTSSQQTALLTDYIIPKKCLTETISFFPLQKIYIRFDVTAKIQNKTISVMDQNIKTVINDNYDILNTDYQQNVYESNFYAIIDSVEDIIYHSTEAYYMERNLNPSVSNAVLLASCISSETSVLEDQNYLVSNSFEIWIRLKNGGVWADPLQIGETTGVNVISIGGTGFTIVNGFVNYSFNQYSFIITEIVSNPTAYGVQDPGDSDPLGYVIYICYKMQDGSGEQANSIRLPRFYQITDIEESFINTDLSYI